MGIARVQHDSGSCACLVLRLSVLPVFVDHLSRENKRSLRFEQEAAGSWEVASIP